MGGAGPGRRHQELPRAIEKTPAARVVPAVPTFSVEGGFWYRIPPHLQPDIGVGSIVRVPLGGRRVRGYVVEMADRSPDRLKEIGALSGDARVFDEKLLQSLAWAAGHYVGPLPVLLDKAAPPTLPGSPPEPVEVETSTRGKASTELSRFLEDVGAGRRRPVVAYVTHWSDADWVTIAQPASATTSTLIVVPTVRESQALATALGPGHGDRVVLVPEGAGSDVTRAWEKANSGGRIVIGTPRISYWSIRGLKLAVVFEEGRRAMKDRQTPTVHVRDLMRTRARIEGFGLLFVGPTPSVELIAAGAEMIRSGRPWGLIEVVDRREDPPGSGFFSERTVAALAASVKAGERSFVFTHRRATDASARCRSCRALRLCRSCDSHVGVAPKCPRCGTVTGECLHCGGGSFEPMGSIPARIVQQLRARLGAEHVGEVGDGRQVTVGTERDLAGLEDLGLAVAVDPDALLHGQNYRASEEALRVLARLVGSVGRRRGHRTIIQTSDPESDLVAALRRGDPVPYLEGVLARRARDGFPPATEMIAVEARNVDPSAVHGVLESAAPGMLLGPATLDDRHRWLLQGDLRQARRELRNGLQKLRDAGATLRVDVDPIDL